ncbi:EamA family transporter [Pyrococcus furiosus DSM 3638]|uniref:EamA domain-containing protein n=3 Tax=Pyrococcus furiosus TaxID=2261 RepID=Q8U3I0_PYRFU|nr:MULTISPECIES: DMT family transporter [Pyrococcus]AAL80610.1 hypothetical protein PF0486 [Pyrococcus furiosus DSM 3638]AFN03280.1 hypothetical protein PFC_01545 [Pyrococcus furiosus COM1]MDK2869361.1 drug/metabolite transporter, family [Pyrococcus sp.]QEK78199.1 EamA family transporter [Pyrococcus furiosus DSM 3638]
MLGIILGLISAFCWGSASVLVKVGLKDKSPVYANVIRLYFSATTYVLIFLITGRLELLVSLPIKYHILAFISGQFGFVIGDYFYFSALKRLGVSRTVPITSTYPLWTILWAFLLGKEITVLTVIGAVLIVIGIVIVRKAETEENVDPVGILYAFLTPIFWSLAIIIMDWLSSRIESLSLAGLRIIYAAVGITFVSWRYLPEFKKATRKELLVLSLAGLLGLVVAQYSFVKGTALVGAEIVTPVTAINPMISTLLAIGLLKEPFNKKILISLILIITGIILISQA